MKKGFSNRWLLLAIVILLLSACSVDLDPSTANTMFGMQALHYEFIIVLISLIGGIGCIIAGIILTILGFSGDIEWVVEVSGFTSKLINASPGIVLIILGTILVIKSRLNINTRKKSKK